MSLITRGAEAWQAAAWWLERCFPHRWGRRSPTKRRTLLPAEELKALAYLRNTEQRTENVTTSKDRCYPSKAAGRPNFAEKISKETGMSPRAINTKAHIGELMSKGVAKALNNREITQKQAEQIVKNKVRTGKISRSRQGQIAAADQNAEIIASCLQALSKIHRLTDQCHICSSTVS